VGGESGSARARVGARGLDDRRGAVRAQAAGRGVDVTTLMGWFTSVSLALMGYDVPSDAVGLGQ
jgi:4-carboxymuconolactone decarboxylase